MRTMISVFLVVMSTSIYAASTTVQGTVNTLRDNADDLWGADSDFLILNGVTSAGNCMKSGSLVMIRIPATADRSFSLALSAQMAGKKVMVNVDDTRVDSGGYCIMRWLNVVN